MKFIRTSDGDINVDRIIRVTHLKRVGLGAPNATICYQDGDDVLSATAYLSADIDVLTRPLTPASPGFFVVQVIGEGPYELYRAPVIAWRVDSHYAMPVTAGNDLASDSNEWGILCPDGRVIVIEEGACDSEEEFLRTAGERLQARKVPA